MFFVLWSSQTYLKFVEQLLQRHLLFRNTLQERLSAEHWKSLVGDILVQLIGQNDVSRRSVFCFWLQTMTLNPEAAHTCSDLDRQPSRICTLDTQQPWRPSSRWSSTDWIIQRTVTMCRYFAGNSIIQSWCIWETRHAGGHSPSAFNRTARWRGRKWSCCPCCWHLCLAYTATWATFRWVT